VINTIVRALRGLPGELVVFMLGAMPVSEVRGAIPVGAWTFHYDIPKTVGLAVLGNLTIVYPLLVFLYAFSHRCRRIPLCGRFLDWWFARVQRKLDRANPVKFWAVLLFVAVPFPLTGAWSGCVAAYLLGMRVRNAAGAVALGVLIAATIVSIITFGTRAAMHVAPVH
jgi:uncharacterized membrane protein